MVTNELAIVENNGYKNIDLTKMKDGDVITVTKKYKECKRVERTSKFDDSKWISVSAAVLYNDQDVGFFLPKGYNSQGMYVEATTYADDFDAVAEEGETVRITCKKGLVEVKTKKTPNGEDVAFKEFVFEKVE